MFRVCLWTAWEAVTRDGHRRELSCTHRRRGPTGAASQPSLLYDCEADPQRSPPRLDAVIDKTNLPSAPASAAAHILLQIMYPAADN